MLTDKELKLAVNEVLEKLIPILIKNIQDGLDPGLAVAQLKIALGEDTEDIFTELCHHKYIEDVIEEDIAKGRISYDPETGSYTPTEIGLMYTE